MFGAAWFLARKDVEYMLRARETLFWVFLMPVVFFFFIGSITRNFGGQGGTAADPLVVEAPADAGFLLPHLESRLDAVGFRVVPGGDPGATPGIPRLVVPAAFTDSVLAGQPATLTLSRRKPGLGADYATFRVQRASLGLLADLVAAAEGGKAPTPEGLEILAQAPRALDLVVTRAGARQNDIPNGFEQAVPGTMVMFTLLVLLTSGSTLLVIERKDGLLRRLASAPLGRGSVIMGKWGGRLMLGLVQLSFAMAVGGLFPGVSWGPNLPMLALVLFVYAGLVALIGIVLGNLARSEGQAVGIGVLASNVLAALGGCWWPIEITPEWMQKLALFLPTGWAMDALHKLVSFGAPPQSVLPHLAIMILAALVVGRVAARTFRFQ